MADTPETLTEPDRTKAAIARADDVKARRAKLRARGVSRTKPQAEARLLEADRQVVQELSLEEANSLVATLKQTLDLIRAGAEDSARVSAVTGEPLPSPSETAIIRKNNLLRAFAARRRLLAGALSATEVAEMLGTSRQTPHDRVQAGTLLAVKDNGRLLFPAWQFDADQSDGVLGGLADVLRALCVPMTGLATAKWFVTPKPDLGDRSPVQALSAGDVDSVVAEAEAVGAS